MLVVFVHGWSVRHADYGALPTWLQHRNAAETTEVWLSDYISYCDDVTMNDLVDAFERARRTQFPDRSFACITHSTGGPVLRSWLEKYHRIANAPCPLTHLVMLAPPNHGSALAQLGKGRLARMKFWVEGVEPGTRILDALELGSIENSVLNQAAFTSDWEARGVYQFVLSGNDIDHKLYDHLNSYTGERGSDGVVRCASANLNFTALRLHQNGAGALEVATIDSSPRIAFGVLAGLAHCGDSKGILNSITTENAATHAIPYWVVRCLAVRSFADYKDLSTALSAMTADASNPCSMVIFRVTDLAGAPVNDYDLLLTSGEAHSPDGLPKGFFIDRQRNSRSPHVLTYYLDHDAMSAAKQLGFRVLPRPDAGPVRYQTAEFSGDLATVATILRPHETVMVDIVLQRQIGTEVFRLRRE